MAKGAIGKQNVIQKIAEALGKAFIGEHDKKIYVWTQENGERIQIDIPLTCPKVMIDAMDAAMPEAPAADFDWSMDTPAAPKAAPVEISQEEKDTVANLMAKLGL